MGNKKKIGLLYGGKSAEYDVSIQTALSVVNTLDQDQYDIYPIHISKQGEWLQGKRISEQISRAAQLELGEGEGETIAAISPHSEWMSQKENNERPDIIFPLLHGPNGEDGTVQGLLELVNMPYVGSGVMASAAAMDKVTMKDVFTARGLPQATYLAFTRKQWESDSKKAFQQVKESIGFPCFIKPANLGSSVGISKCKTMNELDGAFREAFRYDRKIVVEEHVEGREIEIGLLGNDDPDVSVAGEIMSGVAEFYNYQAKYEDEGTSLIIPAELEYETYEEMKNVAIQAFKALDCAGLARIDFFVREHDKAVLINEVNTMPGFTPFSMFPLLWKYTDLSYSDLIDELLALALDRHEQKQLIEYTQDG